jgi:hypothetical protein
VGITTIFTLLMITQTVKPASNCTTVFSKLRLISELVVSRDKNGISKKYVFQYDIINIAVSTFKDHISS